MRVLVTGGAGYIGSHMVQLLHERGHWVRVLDDLSSGHADAVPDETLCVGDVAGPELDTLFRLCDFDAVMHFAGLIQVAQSVRDPAPYYRVNVAATGRLLDCMVCHGVRRLVFSSSAAVYGNPCELPIREDHPKLPINPYGATKWMVEQMLAHYRAAYGLRSVSLRYFNAAGADPLARLGSRHRQETHLIPLMMQALSGRRGQLTVYGNDYDTRDGTCLRDYVHVQDLCEAHLLALKALQHDDLLPAYNLGSGSGCTVLEAIEAAQRVTGRALPYRIGPRRDGDPPVLLADIEAARRDLGWHPRWSATDTLLRHAWAWECRQTAGDRRATPRDGIDRRRWPRFRQGADEVRASL